MIVGIKKGFYRKIVIIIKISLSRIGNVLWEIDCLKECIVDDF